LLLLVDQFRGLALHLPNFGQNVGVHSVEEGVHKNKSNLGFELLSRREKLFIDGWINHES
jgi:hypothetical protein